MLPTLLEKLRAARGPDGRRGGRRHGGDHGRRARASRADRRPADRPGDEGRAAGRDRRPRADDARAGGAAAGAPRAGRSTPAARAATASGTFNISSVAALVVAACGVPVAKHGNRSVSSRCGSADVLRGARRQASPRQPAVVERCLRRGRHRRSSSRRRSTRRCGTRPPARRALGVRTAFNLLGPLTNPAGATRQVVGVPRPELTELVARALLLLGSERAWVVHGADGIDEISTTGYTKVSECRDGAVNTFYVHPADVGLPRRPPGALAGRRYAPTNAAIARGRARGRAGPARDIVLLNAGAALFVAGAVASIATGMARAARGHRRAARPRRALERLVAMSRAEAAGMSERRPDLLAAIVAATSAVSWTCGARRAAGTRWSGAPPRAAAAARALQGRARRARARQRDRRVQAPLAVEGRAARRVRPGGDRAPLRGAGAAAISVLTEPTFFDGALGHLEARPRAPSHAGAAQGLHRRSSTSCSRPGGRGRRRAADRGGARRRRAAGLLARRAEALGLAVLVEVHDADELAIAVDAGARWSASTTATCGRCASTSACSAAHRASRAT